MERHGYALSPEQASGPSEEVLVLLNDGSVVTCTYRSGDSHFLEVSST